jgi:hypothetical protein
VSDIQKLRFKEPLLRRTAEQKTQEPAEINEAPSVKLLDGEVMRGGEIAFAGGTYCEVWIGRWKKEVGEEKVSLSPTTSTLPTRPFVGGLESASDTQGDREGAEGSAFADRLCAASLCLLPRSLETRT